MGDLAPDDDPLLEVGAVPDVDASNQPQIPSAKGNKKRASRACLPCRSRKVRCIVTGSKEPCINCRLDEKECIFVARSKIVRGASRHTANATKPTASSTSPPRDDPRALEDEAVASSVGESVPLPGEPMAVDPSQELPTDFNHDELNDYDYATLNIPPFSSSCPAPGPPECPWIQQEGNQQLLFDPTNPDYSILEAPKTQTLSPEDLDYLYRQGCFVVPHRNILDEFVQQYFLHIHPMLPMLNEAEFWALYLPHTAEGAPADKLPLIVLQGMLFTACSFVHRTTISALGFKSVHDAKSSFYKRAKLLYDFGLETSSISISQAALLLSHSHLIPLPHGGCKQLGPMWLGIALHYARDAGAHRYSSLSSNAPQQSPNQEKLCGVLKRLWWCCVIRDRLMPLTSRRTIKITHSNFNFAGNSVLAGADLLGEADKSRVYDASTKRFLAEIMAKLVELCVILTEVLTLTFPMYDNALRTSTHPATEESRIGDCRMALRRWYSTVLRLRSAQGRDVVKEAETAGSPKNSIVLFMNLLEMYYHSARMALSHYEILYCSIAAPSRQHNRSAAETQESSNELQGAVSQLTQSLRKLVRLRLARWLPISAVGCTAFPLALQILDVKLFNASHTPTREPNNVPLFAQHKQQQLNVLIEAMKTYRPRYDGVDWVAKSVRYIVDLAQKHLPMLETRSDSTISSWTEILQLHPNYYLRLAMTMDLSIRNGKIPNETDFPLSLRGIFDSKLLMSPMSMMLLHSPPREGQQREDQDTAEYQTHNIGINGPRPATAGDNGGSIGENMTYGAGWDNSSGSPSTTPRSSELGFDPLILELGFEAGILSPLVDMEFAGGETAEPVSGDTTSPNQWNPGMPAFDASCLGIPTEEPALESFLEV